MIFTLLVNISFAAQARSAKSAEKALPKITFDKKEKDFGEISEGDIKKFEYTISNTGTGTLTILRLFSPCGCIKLEISPTTIAPGSSAQLKGIFDSKGRWGKQDKAMFIYSNDPTSPSSMLKCWLNIDAGIRVMPRSVSFGEIKSSSKITKKVSIESRLEGKLKLRNAKVSGTDAVTVKIGRSKDKTTVLKNGKMGYLSIVGIEFSVNAKKVKGDFSGKVEIETNSIKQPKILILFSGDFSGELAVEPKMVTFRAVPLGKTATATVRVRGLKKGDFKVIGIDAGEIPDSDGIKMPVTLKAKSLTAKREHDLELIFTAPPTVSKPFIRGHVYLLTDHPLQKRVKLLVNAIIKK